MQFHEKSRARRSSPPVIRRETLRAEGGCARPAQSLRSTVPPSCVHCGCRTADGCLEIPSPGHETIPSAIAPYCIESSTTNIIRHGAIRRLSPKRADRPFALGTINRERVLTIRISGYQSCGVIAPWPRSDNSRIDVELSTPSASYPPPLGPPLEHTDSQSTPGWRSPSQHERGTMT